MAITFGEFLAQRAAQATRERRELEARRATMLNPDGTPKVTTTETDEGISVSVGSADEQIRLSALQKVQTEEERRQAQKLRESRIESAQTAADLQRRTQAIQIEQRGENIGREKARLARESRVARSNMLSRASQGQVTDTSAFRASRIAVGSNLQRETGQIGADEDRNQLLDQIRQEEISANLAARLAENQEPIDVFLAEDKDFTAPGATTVFNTRTI